VVGSVLLLRKCPESFNDQVSRFEAKMVAAKLAVGEVTQRDGAPVEESVDASENPYALAFEESDGFFKDVHERDWKLMKRRQKESRFCLTDCRNQPPHVWYQNNFEPSFTCQHERRIGGMGDGPKWVCDPERIPKKHCLVYSIGSHNDFTFENHVHDEISPDCEIHTFDPTVGAKPSRLPSFVNFHPWGIAKETGRTDMGEMYSIQDIIKKLGHAERSIDIFKIDCEGCEWTSYAAWFESAAIRQIQVEMHANPEGAQALMRHAYANNFVIFHKEPNTLGCKGNCIEYAFLRLTKKFFEYNAALV